MQGCPFETVKNYKILFEEPVFALYDWLKNPCHAVTYCPPYTSGKKLIDKKWFSSFANHVG